MAPSVRVFDDGAWISVGGDRVVGVGELWQLENHSLCDCEDDLIVEGFDDADLVVREEGNGASDVQDAASDDRNVVRARTLGRCLDCGTQGFVGWVDVGSIDDGDFDRFDEPRVAGDGGADTAADSQ
ncbi:MAG: hypothetical protein ABEH81_12360 [Halopenitus sp.]